MEKRVTISFYKAKPQVISLIESETKRLGSISKAIITTVESKIALEITNSLLEKENEELKEKLTYLEDYASGKKEGELYQKATSFPFHNKCYDMLLVHGETDARECICPPSKRLVPIPKDKKTGKYIVRDPRICGRCLALGCRQEKAKSKPTPKTEKVSNNVQQVFCKRDGIWISDQYHCKGCKWTVRECKVKKLLLKEIRG